MFHGTACANRWCLFVAVGAERICGRCIRRARYYRLRWYSRLAFYGLPPDLRAH
jgi:hypothetical protein